MKKTVLFLLVSVLFVSCARNFADKEQASQHDSVSRPQGAASNEPSPAITPADTGSWQLVDKMPTGHEVPIGKLPLLHSSTLAQFQPNPAGFYRYRSLANDTLIKAESVAFFRAKDDTTRILRSVIVDQNEQSANSLIKELIEVKARGYKDFGKEGETARAYYTEINGIPALHQYNQYKKAAFLNVLCGDHRLVLLREDKVTSTDHLIEVAKTMDLKRLSEMVP